MAQDFFQYEKMVEDALRGVAREALKRAARDGLRGGHHFYITFRTGAAGVVLPPQILAKFPEEMTIVLQHQFWGLEVGDHAFSVTLSFNSRMERLTIPFAAITTFADPSVKFGLQFQAPVRLRPNRQKQPFRRHRQPLCPRRRNQRERVRIRAAGRRNRHPRPVPQTLERA